MVKTDRDIPPRKLARFWKVDPDVLFLNHGSFGACPSPVLKVQQQFRDLMEKEPVHFFVRELPKLMDGARAVLAAFVGAETEDLAFVSNVTAGVNAVLSSLPFQEGDELLTTDQEYNACRNTLHYAALRSRARVVVAPVPFPVTSPEDVLRSLLSRVTSRTKLALVDHITSQTGMVFPIARIVSELQKRGVEILVDGAHAPGMVPLDLQSLGADYYTANCHKWLCAPKGAGFLWVRRDRQKAIHPTSISHGFNAPLPEKSRFLVEFDWTGTDDPTAFLSIPAALDFMGGLLPGGWPELMERNRALALSARKILCGVLGVNPPCPGEMIGSMASIPLPDGSEEPPPSPLYRDPLQDELFSAHRIEVPVVPWPAPPKRLLRISAQVYNSLDQYQKLASALSGQFNKSTKTF
jgi:isopenicillin-N epimerase